MTEPKVKSAAALADALRWHRKKQHLSQESLCEAVGLSRSAVAQLERCAANPLLSTLERLAAALDIDVRDLFRAEAESTLLKSDQPALVRAGGNVARLRKKIGKRGMSQETLSKLSGHFRTYVTELEMGRASPAVADLESIAEHIGVQAIDLLEPLEEADYQKYVERFEKTHGAADRAGATERPHIENLHRKKSRGAPHGSGEGQ